MKRKELMASEIAELVVDKAGIEALDVRAKVKGLIIQSFLTGFDAGSRLQAEHVRQVIAVCEEANLYLSDIIRKLPITMRRIGEGEVQ